MEWMCFLLQTVRQIRLHSWTYATAPLPSNGEAATISTNLDTIHESLSQIEIAHFTTQDRGLGSYPWVQVRVCSWTQVLPGDPFEDSPWKDLIFWGYRSILEVSNSIYKRLMGRRSA